MGTHPIFESDFDCLTEKIMRNLALLASLATVFADDETSTSPRTDDGCTVEVTEDSKEKFKTACKSPTIIDDINDLFNPGSTHQIDMQCTKTCGDQAAETISCIGMCYKTVDVPSTQMWAVSFFFVNLVLAVAIGILFMSNSTPATAPPYNKFVFALLVLAAIQIVVSWCGMAPAVSAFAVSGAAVAFTVFSLICAIVVAIGVWRAPPGGVM